MLLFTKTIGIRAKRMINWFFGNIRPVRTAASQEVVIRNGRGIRGRRRGRRAGIRTALQERHNEKNGEQCPPPKQSVFHSDLRDSARLQRKTPPT